MNEAKIYGMDIDLCNATRSTCSKMSEIRLITQLHLEFLNCRHCDDVKVAKPTLLPAAI